MYKAWFVLGMRTGSRGTYPRPNKWGKGRMKEDEKKEILTFY